MKKKKILYLGTHIEISKTILRLIHSNADWSAEAAHSIQDAYSLIHQKPFDLVLIGAGLDELDSREFTVKLKAEFPDLPIVQHYGGGSGLLFAEIYQAIGY